MKENELDRPLIPTKVIREAYTLYTNNFRLFILFSALISVLNLSGIAILLMPLTPTFTVWILGTIILNFICIYFSAKIAITLYLCISNSYQGITTNITENYRQSKTISWKYIGAIIIYSLTIFVPTIGIMLCIDYLNPISMIFCIFFILWQCYWAVRNFLGPTIRIFQPNASKPFVKSRYVASIHLRPLLIIFLITMLPSILYLYYGMFEQYLYTISPIIKLSKFAIYSFVSLFYMPFASCITVITYHRLFGHHEDDTAFLQEDGDIH